MGLYWLVVGRGLIDNWLDGCIVGLILCWMFSQLVGWLDGWLVS